MVTRTDRSFRRIFRCICFPFMAPSAVFRIATFPLPKGHLELPLQRLPRRSPDDPELPKAAKLAAIDQGPCSSYRELKERLGLCLRKSTNKKARKYLSKYNHCNSHISASMINPTTNCNRPVFNISRKREVPGRVAPCAPNNNATYSMVKLQ